MASMSSISALTASELMTDTSVSTTVGGKTYSANVSYANGEYVASDPSLPGAEASASSLQAAENDITMRIDVLA